MKLFIRGSKQVEIVKWTLNFLINLHWVSYRGFNFKNNFYKKIIFKNLGYDSQYKSGDEQLKEDSYQNSYIKCKSYQNSTISCWVLLLVQIFFELYYR